MDREGDQGEGGGIDETRKLLSEAQSLGCPPLFPFVETFSINRGKYFVGSFWYQKVCKFPRSLGVRVNQP